MIINNLCLWAGQSVRDILDTDIRVVMDLEAALIKKMKKKS